MNKPTDFSNWTQELKTTVPKFLSQLRSTRKPGFYHYSLSGDFLSDKFHWGLGNSVFYLKIVKTLKLRDHVQEIKAAQAYIHTFQQPSGEFYDPYIKLLSLPMRFMLSLRHQNFSNLKNRMTIRAETRQSISSLALFGQEPRHPYTQFPHTPKQLDQYFNSLDWTKPWGAASHVSHLLFFLNHSHQAKEFIPLVVKKLKKLQQLDGFIYQGHPTLQQKINGLMKVITGLKVINQIQLNRVDQIIDTCLAAQHDKQACDLFNIVYVLKYCYTLMDKSYRKSEIEQFFTQKILEYKSYYYPQIGGFSFSRNQANKRYYGAPITRGLDEPDIHGTMMFLWGLSVMEEVMSQNSQLFEVIP